MKSLSQYPQPQKNKGLGLHVLAQATNRLFADDPAGCENRIRFLDVWNRMGVQWLKWVTTGDSQLSAVEFFQSHGFTCIVRPYHEGIENGAPFSGVPEQDLLDKIKQTGADYVEPYTNEPEIEWGVWPSATTIELLANIAQRHADNCARAGLIPLLPAIQGDRLYTWAWPMWKKMIDNGRKDALEGSIINIHNRPGVYFGQYRCTPPEPSRVFGPDTDPNMPDGGCGFSFRSYEKWIFEFAKLAGWCPPILGTEAGFEPSDFPEAAYKGQLHSQMNSEIMAMSWGKELFCQCFWTFMPDWADSGWWRGSIESSLPIVNNWMSMSFPVRNGVADTIIPFEAWRNHLPKDIALAAVELASREFPLLQKDAAECLRIQLPTSFEGEFCWNNSKFLAQRYGMKDSAIIIVRQVGDFADQHYIALRY